LRIQIDELPENINFTQSRIMKRFSKYFFPKKPFVLFFLSGFLLLGFVGCLASPVGQSGGVGAVTVNNTNVAAIMEAAGDVFPQYGYTMGPVNYPDSFSFEKPAGGFGNLMWGSYHEPQTIRVRVRVQPLADGNNYRLIPNVYSVTSAGEMGFEDQRPLIGLWSAEFRPILRKIQAQAAGAGSGYQF